MEDIIGAPAAGNGAVPDSELIKEVSLETFQQDVLEASLTTPVIVDFWATWCGPCKQLTPILEKVVRSARGAVRLAKIDIDQNPEIAQQMRIQSVPTVYAFVGGRPVDAFQGAIPESQIKAFVDKLAAAAGTAQANPIDDALAQAKELLGTNDFETAAAIYEQVLQHEPDNVDALGGLARCMVATERLDEARAILARAPDDAEGNIDIAAARAALELAAQSAAIGDLAPLEAAVDADPKDYRSRFDLAVGLFAKGRREEAIDHLVEIIRRDRTWNDDAARKQLIQFFETMDPADEVTVAGRRKMSAVLFS